MTIPRTSPYIHVGWLKKLIVGDDSCEWASWFKSHFQQYAKMPSDFDLAMWKMEHTTLLGNLRNEIDTDGRIVRLENQNNFRLTGKTGITVSGTPDLVAIEGATGVIYDTKTGQPHDYDTAQVMIYMWALPYTRAEYKNILFEGELVYSDHRVHIPSNAVNDEFQNKLVGLIGRIGSDTEAIRVPSGQECRFCDLTAIDCPERIEESDGGAFTDAF